MNLSSSNPSNLHPSTPVGQPSAQVVPSAEVQSSSTTAAPNANNATKRPSSNNKASNGKDNQENNDKAIQQAYEDYMLWKNNTPFLYDVVLSHALEWPSLTCQWLPTLPSNNFDTAMPDRIERVLLGTHTSDEQNYLVLASVNLGSNSDSCLFLQDQDSPFAPHPLNAGGLNKVDSLDNSELGGYGPASQTQLCMDLKIKHVGEVNRARVMPQNPCIVATKSPTGEVFIFDLVKHFTAISEQQADPGPQLRLKGHSREGYGLSWNPTMKGYLLSASEDHTICLWTVNQCPEGHSILDAATIYTGHSSIVEDVSWHWSQPTVFGSVGDDGQLMIWDIRSHNYAKPSQSVLAHHNEVNCIAFSPFSDFIVITGSADHTVGLWDNRNLSSSLHVFKGHTDEIFQVQWSSCNETILASAGTDRQVIIWDISRIGEDKLPPMKNASSRMSTGCSDGSDGPPEMVFIHYGHSAKISDFCWHPTIPWMVCSTSEDNIFQAWRVAEEICEDELFAKIYEEQS